VGSAAALGLGVNMPTVSYADQASGCNFAPTGTTASSLGALTGNTFDGGDGNMLTTPTTCGTTDWQNVGGLHTGIDLPSGGGDNAFGQGTKEDDPNVSVVTGSIPPQKTMKNSGAARDPARISKTGLVPGTYTCTLVIDP
jgi:hypothetical protein